MSPLSWPPVRDGRWSFPEPSTHYVEVRVVAPAGPGEATELMMPVWTPGSYLVREFARHVERVRAQTLDGHPLAVTKVTKNRWRVQSEGQERFVFFYRLYAR